MGSQESPLPCFLVEWYGAELTAEVLERTAAELTRAAVTDTRLVMTLAVPTDDVVFAVFAAESAAVVQEACSMAGYPALRVTAAIAARGRPDAS